MLLLGFSTEKYVVAGSIVGIVALMLFIYPIIGAYRVSKTLNAELEQAFGVQPEKHEGSAFHPLQMISGINTPQIPYITKAYSNVNGKSLELDLYPSQIPGNRPCVIVVHGGSWAGGDSRQLPELNSYLAKLGYHVASINYRMAPEFQCPAPVEDLKNALQYLRSHATELSIDTNNFVLLGRSAGAQIAMLAAYTFHDTTIRGVVSFYGPADMVWGYSLPANPLVMDSRKVMEDYLGGTYKQVPQKYFESSPVEFVSAQAPPTLMIHGPNDPLVAYEHNTHLIAKLKQYHIKHYLLTLPWATHGCDYTLNGPSGQLSTYAVTRFLKAVVK